MKTTQPPWKLLLILAATAVLGAAIARHVDGINGPDYWRWPWRVYRGLTPYLILFLAATPTFIAQLRLHSTQSSVLRPPSYFSGLLLMMVGVLAFELANRGLDMVPFDLTRIGSIIEQPGSIGYFTHAEEMDQSGESIHDFLHDFARKMPTFTLHARNKPPGSILFYLPFLRLAPTWDAAAMSAGLFIALLTTLSVPATYLMALELTGNRRAAFDAAALLSLCPGLLLFLPEFDQFYPVYTSALVILWARSLRTGRTGFAVAFGVALALVFFQTFNLLLLGVFLTGYTAMFLLGRISPAQSSARHRSPQAVLGSTELAEVSPQSHVFHQSLVALLTLTTVYTMLWLWCGYNPVRTLVMGITTHVQDMPATHRIWPRTVPYDLTDFALGMGWVCALLALFYLPKGWRQGILLLCFAQPVAVALLGLLQGETARVWIFIFPLVLVPAGLELAGWSRARRLAVLGCLWLLTALLSQNMVFV
jgi:hypothetical protein